MTAGDAEGAECSACGKRLYKARICRRCGQPFCVKHINPRIHGCLPPSAATRYLTPKVGALIVVALMAIVSFLIFEQIRPKPEKVHLSWQDDPTTTMTVMWWTEKPGEGKLKYGKFLLDGSTTSTSQAYDGGYLHTAEITGLEPGNRYRYKCGGGGEWSPTKSFRTAPPGDASSSFTFSFLADSRSQPKIRREVAEVVRKKGQDFMVDAGDLVSDGTIQDQWDQWFRDMEDVLPNAPFMCVVGNHEKNTDLYYDQFAFPDGEEYYSFNYGNAHFVGLNSEIEINGTQVEWLEKDLAQARADPDIVWIIAFFHRPIFTASNHAGEEEIAEIWGPIMDTYHVDLVFTGHNHCYERTSALFSNGTITNRGQHLVDPVGTIHLTSGGAGAPLYDTKDADFIEHARSYYHFIQVSIDGKRLELDAIRETGRAFDTLVIDKS